MHPKSGETHTQLQRGGTRANPTWICVLLGLCSGDEWAAGPVATQPARALPDTLCQGHCASPGGATGTRSSHPHLLGDCCQVRNSKGEFIILADK